MSAGRFVRTRYAADYAANIHPIRVQEETITLVVGGVTNSPPVGAINNPIQCSVSRGKRTVGLRARLFSLRTPATGAPAGYLPNGIITLPALSPTFAAAVNIATSTTAINYLGVTGWTVVGKIRPEVV